jgi:hypothetical protein
VTATTLNETNVHEAPVMESLVVKSALSNAGYDAGAVTIQVTIKTRVQSPYMGVLNATLAVSR